MTRRLINITDSDNITHLFGLNEGDELHVSVFVHDEHDVTVCTIANTAGDIELMVDKRDGMEQAWHERSDS